MSVQIPLGGGRFALVDTQDAERIAASKWHIMKPGPGRSYAGRRPHGRTVLMHREVLEAPDGMTVDHVNGDTLDNRRENLRLATMAQNSRNKRSRGTVPYTGVGMTRDGKFKALIWPSGKGIYLGTFTTAEQAAGVYNAAAKLIYGDFARLNEVQTDHDAIARLPMEKQFALLRWSLTNGVDIAQKTKSETESGSKCKSNHNQPWQPRNTSH